MNYKNLSLQLLILSLIGLIHQWRKQLFTWKASKHDNNYCTTCFCLSVFCSGELNTLRLWVDAASQNAWDTGKSWIDLNMLNKQTTYNIHVTIRWAPAVWHSVTALPPYPLWKILVTPMYGITSQSRFSDFDVMVSLQHFVSSAVRFQKTHFMLPIFLGRSWFRIVFDIRNIHDTEKWCGEIRDYSSGC